jgi:hypothetical protein
MEVPQRHSGDPPAWLGLIGNDHIFKDDFAGIFAPAERQSQYFHARH